MLNRMNFKHALSTIVSGCFIFSQAVAPVFAADVTTDGTTTSASTSTVPQTVDLGSSQANIQFTIPDGKTVTIQQGDTSLQLSSTQTLTAGQYAAAKQVLYTGHQSVVLGANGEALSGQVNIGYLARSFPTSSLVIPENVTALNNQGVTGALVTTGSITNAGSLYAFSTNPQVTTASISAANIFNQSSGLITTALSQTLINQIGAANLVANMNLTLNATNNIVNAGSIISAGNLNLNAGQSIINQSTTAGVTAVLQAQNNITLNSVIGNFVNTGNITANLGNINIVSGAMHDILFNNVGGTLSALNGAINFRDSCYSDVGNLSVIGGDLLSKELNLYSGKGEINLDVGNVTGIITTAAGANHITADTPTLVLGDQIILGDPTWYNTGGDVLIAGNIVATGASPNIAIAASGNIISVSGAGVIDSSSAQTGAAGGALTLIAGALITTGGAATGSNNTTTTINVKNPTATGTGGGIYLDGTAPTGFAGTAAPITGLTSSGVGGNASGGNIYLGAYQGTAAGSGVIRLPSAVTITSSGSGAGNSSGSVTIQAGASSGTSISIGSVDTSATNRATAGAISIVTGQPAAPGAGINITNGTLGGAFGAPSARAAAINIAGSVSASGSDGTTNNTGTAGAAITLGNASTTTLTIGGSVLANGGAGGAGSDGISQAVPTNGQPGQNGSNGGILTLRAGTITVSGNLSSAGGNGGRGGNAGDDLSGNNNGLNGRNGGGGGDAGTITVTSSGGNIVVNGSVLSTGGTGGNGGAGGDGSGSSKDGGAGGNGGQAGRGAAIQLNSGGTLTVGGDIFSRSGIGGAGGTGGLSGQGGGNSDGGRGGNGGTSDTGAAITLTSASNILVLGGISSSSMGGGDGGTGSVGLRFGGAGGTGGNSQSNSGAISITATSGGISIAGNIDSSQRSGGRGGNGGAGGITGGAGGGGGNANANGGNITVITTNSGVVSLGNVISNGAAPGAAGTAGAGGAAGSVGTGVGQPGDITLRSDQTNNGSPLLINGYISATAGNSLTAVTGTPITLSGSRIAVYGTGLNVAGTNYSVYGGTTVSITGNGSGISLNYPSALDLSSSSTTATSLTTSAFLADNAAVTSLSNGTNNALATKTSITINGSNPSAPNIINSITNAQSFNPSGGASLSIIENGVQKAFTSGSNMTAAERVAAVQVSSTGTQLLIVGAGGIATSGSLIIDTVNLPAATDNSGSFSTIVIPQNVLATVPMSTNLPVTGAVTANGTMNFTNASGGTLSTGASGLTVGSAGIISSTGNLTVNTPSLNNSGLITSGGNNGRLTIASSTDLAVTGNGTLSMTGTGDLSLGNNIYLSAGTGRTVSLNGSLSYDPGNYGYVTWTADNGTVTFGNNTTQSVLNNGLTYIQAPTVNFGSNSAVSAGTSNININATPFAPQLRINAPSGGTATLSTTGGLIVVQPQPNTSLLFGTTGATAGTLNFNSATGTVIRTYHADTTINSTVTLTSNGPTSIQEVGGTLTVNGTINNTAGGLGFNAGSETLTLAGTPGAINGAGVINFYGDLGTFNFNNTVNLNAGAGGTVGIYANNINLNNGSVVTATNGGNVDMYVDTLRLSSGSQLVSTAAGGVGISMRSNSVGNMTITAPNGGSATLATSGSVIQIQPLTGATFNTTGAGPATLNLNGGNASINTHSGNVTIASGVTLASNRNLSINAGSFTDNGTVTSSNPSGSITIAGTNLSMSGTPSPITLTGGGAGTIGIYGYDQSTLSFNNSFTFNPGSGGSTLISVPAGTVNLAPSIAVTAAGGGPLTVDAQGITFGSNSSLVSQATSGTAMTVTAPNTDLTINVTGNGYLTSSGGAINISPPGGGHTLRFTSGTSGTLNVTGGVLNINAVDAAVVNSGVTITSNNQVNFNEGLVNNGTVTASGNNIGFNATNVDISGAGTLSASQISLIGSNYVNATQATISGIISGSAVNGFTLGVTGSNGYTVGNISTSNGDISLLANGGWLTVNNGAVITANEGNLLIQNQNEATGNIWIGTNAQVGAFTVGNPAKGTTEIVVGALPTAPYSTSAKPSTVTENIAGGASIYYGSNGIIALGSSNVINAIGRDVIFSTNSRSASAITLAGGNTVTSDPPVAGATLLYGHVSAGASAATANATSAPVAPIQTSSPMQTSRTSPAPQMNAPSSVAESKIASASLPSFAAPQVNVIPSNTVIKTNATGSLRAVGFGGNGIVVNSGEALLCSADGDRIIDLGSATVTLPSKAVALVEREGTLSKVRVLVDSATVKVGKRSIELDAGQELVIAADEDQLLSGTINDGIGRRFTRQLTVDGNEVLYGDFSIMSLIPRSEVLSAMRFSHNRQERAMFERVMKMTACLYVVTAKHGQYKEYRH